MPTVHFILQAKGGIGKSTIAAMLLQAAQESGKEALGLDLDPLNASLAAFKELNVKRVNIMEDTRINPRLMDRIYDSMEGIAEDGHIIIDNGASSYIDFVSYIQANNVVGTLEDSGYKVMFHTVIVGGDNVMFTLGGVKDLVEAFPNVPLVVWLNTYFGKIELDGKKFNEFAIYEQYSQYFHAVINLPHIMKETLGEDLQEMFAKRQSFHTAILTGHVAVKARLKRYWGQVVECIKGADII